MTQIVLCYPTEPWHRQQISHVLSEIQVDAQIVDAGQDGVAEALLQGPEILCGHVKVPVDWERVISQGTLRWIQSSAAGLDHCLTPPVINSQVIVTSASGVLSNQVAEHTVALVTSLVRSFPEFFRAQQQKVYERRPTRDLHGSAIAIVGYGGVGRRVGEVLTPFKTRVTAFDLYPVDPLPGVTLRHIDELDEALPEFDIVILCIPLTNLTRGMFNAKRFARFRKGALFVNVARGSVVVECDLIEALQSEHIAAAGLDVAEVEPLPRESPLWDLPNVIITPHVGGQSQNRADDMTNFMCENLRRYFQGRPLLNYVDKRQGFPIPSQQGRQPTRIHRSNG
ncbi:MAG: D-2-hydroxyacid dehydrogenase [Pirellulales bacterium]|nr:D-2-hydroxyacid dehydrogenase [Pirellulales bacterium]